MLARIPGGRLRKDAALRWNSMCITARRRGLPVPMPNGPNSSYRDLAGQIRMRSMWCSMGKCQNAAIPGFSNHGWGIAVDTNQGWVCDRLSGFGFHKRHSDAPWEGWHRKWSGRGRIVRPKPDEVVIKKGMGRNRAVQTLQVLLRRAGYLPKRHKVGSTYGLKTRRAVRKFQKKRGMKVDGIVGPATWRALRRAAK